MDPTPVATPATFNRYTTSHPPGADPGPRPYGSARATVRTRILIISDTHGVQLTTEPPPANVDAPSSPCTLHGHSASRSPFHYPLPEADVVIHCGDLTKRSTIEEYRSTAALLRGVRAPVKIVIAGNHDVSLHDSYYRERVASFSKDDRPDFGWLSRNLATNHDARTVIASSSPDDGIIYVEEGTHDVVLPNGASLRVYTSPWTPSYGGWAFQYNGPHAFDIPADADVAVTHGPPKGVLDYAASGDRAGCEHLFRAVEKARPRIHCFGHIHEAWGAYYGHWAEAPGVVGPDDTAMTEDDDPHDAYETFDSASVLSISSNRSLPQQLPPPQTLRYFDTSRSRRLEDITTIKLAPLIDSEDDTREKRARYAEYSALGCRPVDITMEGDIPVEKGQQTLFLNAAILDRRYKIAQFPWLVEIDLPMA
ncbi:uncharacterized protein DNG_06485 [Cephalotrichum gorgonifer]|uniref:Calcineurin-like phosphoesterase domain-containing protein n=1 Tax=Cephalotrichum gorgonifer TaxID=2041049 RepID=A0AAE8N0F4_9PEZI|nr:uncharacterized protein DNG_06485 [Cephalotrichum gorgonifer]